MEFHSPIPESIGCITFQNYYTHTLTMKFTTGQISNLKSDQASTWKTCIKSLKLMPNCHYERGSESLIVLNSAHFSAPLEKVSCLRLILRQPSPDWNQFGIRDLKCYSVSSPFCCNETQRNGIETSNTSLSERMEQILQNGLWTKNSDTNMEPGPTHNTQRHSYTVSVLPYT